MRIYYDNIIFSLQKAGGISVYFYEIIKRLKIDEYTLIETGEEEKNIFYKKLSSLKRVISNQSVFPIKLLRYTDVKIKSNEKFIFHSTYYRICKNKNAINVTTVHDFTHEKYFGFIKRTINHIQKKRAILNSDLIICISENTKKDLLYYIPKAREKNIKVIYNGVSEEFFKKEKVETLLDQKLSKQKYILYIGARRGYKRFDIVLDIMKTLNDEYKLIIVGGEEFTSDEKTKLIENTSGKYQHIKGISNEELNSFYNYAFCIIYPSEYEGFGIPILEAMKAGCPVLAYNNSSIPEISGPSLLVNKNLSKEYLKNILKLKNNINRNKIIKEGIIFSKNFSWEKMYIDISNEYEKIRFKIEDKEC